MLTILFLSFIEFSWISLYVLMKLKLRNAFVTLVTRNIFGGVKVDYLWQTNDMDRVDCRSGKQFFVLLTYDKYSNRTKEFGFGCEMKSNGAEKSVCRKNLGDWRTIEKWKDDKKALEIRVLAFRISCPMNDLELKTRKCLFIICLNPKFYFFSFS